MSLKITVLSGLFFCLGVVQLSNIYAQEHSYVPGNGFVPDQATAAVLAEAILKPIYGEQNIERQKPLRVSFKNDVWVVRGGLPEGLMGGVAMIEISKKDAKVIRVSHGK